MNKKVATKKAAAKPAAKAPVKRAPAKPAPRTPRRPRAPKVEAPAVAPAAPAAEPPIAPIAPDLVVDQEKFMGEQQQKPSVLNADALASLNNIGGDAPPQGEEHAQPSPEEMAAAEERDMQTEMFAAMGVGMFIGGAEKLAVKYYHPAAAFPEKVKGEAVAALLPVAMKYASGGSGVMPEWVVKFIMPFLLELKAIAKLGTLAYAVITNVNKAQAEEAERAREAEAARLRGEKGPQFQTEAAAG